MRAFHPLRSGAIVFAVCGIVGCGSDLSTGPGLVVKDLNGSWTQLDLVIGSSQHWTLSTQDTIVTGTGTWSAEACCGGTLTVSGYSSGDSVHLLVLRNNDPRTGPGVPYSWEFDGTLTSPTMLVGDGVRFKKD
jgi:hypothetical protein